MISRQEIKYAMRNLLARKARTFLTALSIFVGIATIFIFLSFGWGLWDYVNDIAAESGVDKVIVQARGTGAPGIDQTFKLEDKDLRAVERTKGISEAAGAYFQSGEVEKGDQKKYSFITGLPGDLRKNKLIVEMFTVDIRKGRPLRKGDSGKVVLGYNYIVPDRVFTKPVKIGEKIKIQDKKFEIVGVYDAIGNPSDDANVYLTENDFLDLYPDASYGFIIGRANDIEAIDAIAERVEKSLRKARDLEEGKEDFFVQTFQEAIDQFMGVLNIIIGFIILIAGISVVVSMINTANTMVTSVLERTKEIGIMKSIGARNATIRNIFILESSTIGAMAGIIGVALGWFLTSTGANLLDQLGFGFLSPHYSWQLFAGAVLFATVVGGISGLLPAIQASKQSPVDALRYE
jgi:putative ABC transport system permease protein